MRRLVLVVSLFCLTMHGYSQVRQIDRSKLPQDATAQTAYTDPLSIDEYARNYAQKWPYRYRKSRLHCAL